MASPLVLTDLQDGVAIVSMNRPEKHNAVNDEMGAAMREAMAWAYDEKNARCILLCAEGPSFCSGRDTTELGQRKGDDSHYFFVKHTQYGRFAAFEADKVIVAAVQGFAIGGGFESALAADIRVAATDAVFSLPEIKYGILPDTGGSQILTTLVGPSKAKYLVMTGDRLDAKTALAWGVVDWVVEPDELRAKALGIAKRIAEAPPIALSMAKQNVNQIWDGAIRNGLRQELLSISALYGTEDYKEARAALREKRKPVYKGK